MFDMDFERLRLFINHELQKKIMNHRYGSRVSAQVDVLLYRRRERLGKYKTRDISAHGAFLVTGEMDLHLGALIEITFILTENPADQHQVKGMLVRRSATGIGVIFADVSHRVLSGLKTINQTKTTVGLNDRIKEENNGWPVKNGGNCTVPTGNLSG